MTSYLSQPWPQSWIPGNYGEGRPTGRTLLHSRLPIQGGLKAGSKAGSQCPWVRGHPVESIFPQFAGTVFIAPIV